MRHKIGFAQLHVQVFVNGTNLGDKLPGKFTRDVAMEYDTELQGLLVGFKGKLAFVPHGSVALAEFTNPHEIYPLPVGTNHNEKINSNPPVVESPACQPALAMPAQVEVPTKPAEGKTGRGEKLNKAA